MSTTDSLTFADPGRSAGEPGAGHGRRGVGRAHGKAILLGEHAVVYGAPALAIPVPQLSATAHAKRLPVGGDGADRTSFAIVEPGTASVTPLDTDGLRLLVAEFKRRAIVVEPMCVDVLIDCAIPHGRGLGSSAACARAAVLALADAFDRQLDARTVYDLVQASETATHGRASGIDAFATGATSPIYFRTSTPPEPPVARELPIAIPDDGSAHSPEPGDGRGDANRPWGFDALFVVADSGVSGSTKEAVELLRHKFEQTPRKREDFVHRVSSLTYAALRDLGHGELGEFGARLTENHQLLHELGISTDRIDAMVEAALAAGGLGAKLSGGGLGGCMIALAEDPRGAEAVARRLDEAGAVRSWVIPVGRFANHVH